MAVSCPPLPRRIRRFPPRRLLEAVKTAPSGHCEAGEVRDASADVTLVTKTRAVSAASQSGEPDAVQVDDKLTDDQSTARLEHAM